MNTFNCVMCYLHMARHNLYKDSERERDFTNINMYPYRIFYETLHKEKRKEDNILFSETKICSENKIVVSPFLDFIP